jgi:hypothetical protein
VLPTFLVIGVAKAGTTTLHRHLRSHPDVYVPGQKEINFFWPDAAAHGRRVPVDLDAYERAFDDAGDARAVGEVAPRYFSSEGAAARIADALPAARLVLVLRDPVTRAWSDYLGRVRIGTEDRPFADAVAPGEPCFEWGRYAARLTAYLDRFPREQLLVLRNDELASDTAGTMRTIWSFLGVDAGVPVDTARRVNVGGVPRFPALSRTAWRAAAIAQRAIPPSRRGSDRATALLDRLARPAPVLDPAVARALRERYRSDVERTASLLGWDLAAWCGDQPAA